MRKSGMKEVALKRLAMVGLLILGAGLFMSVIVSPAMAGKPECDPVTGKHCKNTGGEDDGGVLVAKFCLGIADESPGFEGDGSPSDDGDYCHRNKKDKLLVFTGNGPGFRFDTNKGKSTAQRYVWLNFSPNTFAYDADGVSHTFLSGLYEIDFRFDLDWGGLDLGGITVDEQDNVPIGVKIQTLDGSELGLLGYGEAASLFSDPSLDTTCMDSDTSNALVTRIADKEWTIESDPLNSNACLWVGHSNFYDQFGDPIQGIPIEMPFDFTIFID